MSKREFQINVSVDFEKGRGFAPMAEGLPSSLLKGEPSKVLSTIAMLYLNPTVERNNGYSLAMATLALFAAGTHVTLNRQQFRRLERKVRQYRGIMDAPMYEPRCPSPTNSELADYVLTRACRRAKAHKVI